jgi:phosphatidylglycerol:prolipoprotein diacylglycerol transferase
MFPDLFSIGPFTIHTYGLLVAIGILVGLMVTVRTGRSMGISSQQVMDMGFMMIIIAIIGSRVMYILMNISYYRQHWVNMFKLWEGGLVFSGAIVGVILAMWWYARRHRLSLWKLGDLWVPGAAIGQGIGRIGCFMAGCCYGRPTDLKWSVVFSDPRSLAPLNVSLHPTQIYASLSNLVIFLILLLMLSRKKFDGQIFLWFLILHSTARLFIERFRGDELGRVLGSSMSVTQLLSTVILVTSVITLIVLKTKMDRQSPEP